MKATIKRVKLDKSKLFGFNQTSSGKKNSKNAFATPMIGSGKVGAVKA